MVLIQMKAFTASQLSHTPAKVLAEARTNGVIIQQKRTNGDVIEEFVMISNNGNSIYNLSESHKACSDPQCQYCSEDW